MCVHIQMYIYGKGILKSRAMTPSCNLRVHTTTSRERTEDNILMSKSLPGEGTHENKSYWTYLEETRQEYHGTLKGYSRRRVIGHQRQGRKWEKRITVSISELGGNYLGRQEALLSSGPFGSVQLKERSWEQDTAQHAACFSLNPGRPHQRATATPRAPCSTLFLQCTNTEEEEGHWRLQEYMGRPEILGLVVSLTMDSLPRPGKEERLSVNPQTVMFHICCDKLQRYLLAFKQIQTNSRRFKWNGKKKLAWSLPELTNNNQSFLEVLQVSIRAAINRWFRFKTWNHP